MPDLQLTLIDQLIKPEYHYLDNQDYCYFIHQYTVDPQKNKQSWEYSKTNQAIYNLKKPKGARGYEYKASSIEKFSNDLREIFNQADISNYAFVPMPPSKVKGDDAYDDRIVQICRKVFNDRAVELVEQTQNRYAAHASGNRESPDEKIKNLRLLPHTHSFQ